MYENTFPLVNSDKQFFLSTLRQKKVQRQYFPVRPFLLAFALILPVTAKPQTTPVVMFPSEKIFPSFKADALSHQLSIARVTDNRDWIGAIGGSLPVVQVNSCSIEAQFTVAATAFSRIVKTPGHITVFTLDYRVDFPIDLQVDDWSFRLGYGHISSHYADDGIEQLGKASISAVKDYLSFGLARKLSVIGGFAYASTQFNYHNEPVADKKWMLQFGGEFGETSISDIARLYAAIDVKVKQEVAWGTTQSYQVGLKMFERESRCIRVAYTHRRGFEERGQLFNQTVAANLISLFLDF